MSATPSVSPHLTGFSPQEISALVNRRTVEEHASEAAFLWMRRQQAAEAPHFKLQQLHKLDARVIAHLQGLTLPGVSDGVLIEQMLGHADAGAIFVAVYIAFFRGNTAGMRNVLKVALTEPALTDALVHSLAWLAPERSAAALERLHVSTMPEHRFVALSAAALLRSPDGTSNWLQGTQAAEPAIRARALRALGENGLRTHLHLAQGGLHDPDPQCRFWAAWSSTLLGDATAAPVVWDAGLHAPELHEHALAVAMRLGDADWARGVIRGLARDTTSLRLALRAAGAFGDPMVIPWLLDRMEDRPCARVAGEAFASITGADLEYLDLDTEPPEDADHHDEAHPPDVELRWPDPTAVRRWWSQRQDALQPGTRYLCGHPLTAPAMLRLLREGYQRQRAGAAIELARARSGGVLFPVSERADRQLQRLAT